jgi:hypothetical protein
MKNARATTPTANTAPTAIKTHRNGGSVSHSLGGLAGPFGRRCVHEVALQPFDACKPIIALPDGNLAHAETARPLVPDKVSDRGANHVDDAARGDEDDHANGRDNDCRHDQRDHDAKVVEEECRVWCEFR